MQACFSGTQASVFMTPGPAGGGAQPQAPRRIYYDGAVVAAASGTFAALAAGVVQELERAYYDVARGAWGCAQPALHRVLASDGCALPLRCAEL